MGAGKTDKLKRDRTAPSYSRPALFIVERRRSSAEGPRSSSPDAAKGLPVNPQGRWRERDRERAPRMYSFLWPGLVMNFCRAGAMLIYADVASFSAQLGHIRR